MRDHACKCATTLFARKVLVEKSFDVKFCSGILMHIDEVCLQHTHDCMFTTVALHPFAAVQHVFKLYRLQVQALFQTDVTGTIFKTE